MIDHTPAPWKWGEDLIETRKLEHTMYSDYSEFPKYASIELSNPNHSSGRELVLPLRIDHYEIIFDGYLKDLKPGNLALMEKSPEMYELLYKLINANSLQELADTLMDVENLLEDIKIQYNLYK